MIGHLELGYVTCVLGVALKMCPQSQIFLRCVRADLDLILNALHHIYKAWMNFDVLLWLKTMVLEWQKQLKEIDLFFKILSFCHPAQ